MTPPASPAPDLLLLGASSLVTPRSDMPGGALLDTVPGGWVAGLGGRILATGGPADLPLEWRDAPGIRRVDAAGGTVLPGFIDPHTHLVHAGSREDELARRLAGASYSEIAAAGGGIVRTVAETRRASSEVLLGLALGRLDRMLLGGTTTCEAKSGYGLDVDTELRQLEVVREAGRLHPVELVPTYLGAHVVPAEHRSDRERYVRLVLDEALPAVAERKLAAFCDVFCDEGAFTVEESRRILERAASLGLGLKVHADELTSCGGAELAAEMGAASAEHLLKASDAGLAALARAGTVAVVLPATSLFLMEEPLAAERLRRAACAVAIGTDLNPGSSPTGNLALAATLACLRNRMTPDEALLGMTLHAARSMRRERDIGSLETGKRLDVVVLDAPSHLHLVYRLGANLVRHVIKGGRVVVEDGRRVG